MTYKQAAQTSLDIQNGCNASGIISTLAKDVVPAIWNHAQENGKGTREVNGSPIIAMFLYKLGELNGRDISSLNDGYDAAEKEVQQILEAE